MSKLYKVRLAAHAGATRRRAGLYFEKGVPQTLELDKEQLEALQNDSYFTVKEAGEGEGSDDDTNQEVNLNNLKRSELDQMAKDLKLNPADYNNKEALIAAIEAAPEPGEGSDDEEEDVVLSELSVDDLKVIATELELNTADYNAETEEATKAKLIEAIEAAKAKEE